MDPNSPDLHPGDGLTTYTAHPLQVAVALGLLPAHMLSCLLDADTDTDAPLPCDGGL